MRVDQCPAAIRYEVAAAEGLHVAVCCNGRGDQRIAAYWRGIAAVQLKKDLADGRQEDDVLVDGVFRYVLGQSALHRPRVRVQGGCGRVYSGTARIFRGPQRQGIAGVTSDGVVGGKEAYIGCSLEQIAHENVDDDLRTGARCEQRLPMCLGLQMSDEVGCE